MDTNQGGKAGIFNTANRTAEGYVTFPMAFSTSAFDILVTHAYISTAVVKDPKSATITALSKTNTYIKLYNMDGSRPTYSVDVFYMVVGY